MKKTKNKVPVVATTGSAVAPSGLSSPDVGAWLASNVTRLHSLTTGAKLSQVVSEEIGAVLRFRAALALIGNLRGDQVQIMDVVNCGYPEELVDRVRLGIDLASRPTARRWLAERKPIFIPALPIAAPTSDEAADVIRHELGCRAVHGAFDINGKIGTYFNFCGLPSDAEPWIKPQLELLVPHLHCVLARIWQAKCKDQADRLSGRERSLVQLVSNGLTNPEIAREWNRSAATVRNTLHRLMTKLGVRSRVQLVLAARDLQLL
jgi:DNA-binding CsgD family transcriptional regulator